MGYVGLFVVGAIFGFVIATLILKKPKSDSNVVGGGGNSPADNDDIHERV